MTQPGWYPDQSGGPGRKYWDGQAWHDEMPTAPAPVPAPAPTPVPGPPATPTPRPSPNPPRPVPAAAKRSGIPMWARYVFAAVMAIVGVLVSRHGLSQIDGPNRATVPRMSSPALGVPAAGLPGLPAPAKSQDAALGTPLQIDFQTIQMNGTFASSSAAMKVDRLERFPDGFIPTPAGAYYGVLVQVASITGKVPVDPTTFSARTNVSTNVPATPWLDTSNLLPATELPQGQRVAGWVCFDVPQGQSIKEIVLEDPFAGQLARWTVK